MASAGMAAIGRFKLGGLLPVSAVFAASRKVGAAVAARRRQEPVKAPAPGLTVLETD
jgi:hypothetical protein